VSIPLDGLPLPPPPPPPPLQEHGSPASYAVEMDEAHSRADSPRMVGFYNVLLIYLMLLVNVQYCCCIKPVQEALVSLFDELLEQGAFSVDLDCMSAKEATAMIIQVWGLRPLAKPFTYLMFQLLLYFVPSAWFWFYLRALRGEEWGDEGEQVQPRQHEGAGGANTKKGGQRRLSGVMRTSSQKTPGGENADEECGVVGEENKQAGTEEGMREAGKRARKVKRKLKKKRRNSKGCHDGLVLRWLEDCWTVFLVYFNFFAILGVFLVVLATPITVNSSFYLFGALYIIAGSKLRSDASNGGVLKKEQHLLWAWRWLLRYISLVLLVGFVWARLESQDLSILIESSPTKCINKLNEANGISHLFGFRSFATSFAFSGWASLNIAFFLLLIGVAQLLVGHKAIVASYHLKKSLMVQSCGKTYTLPGRYQKYALSKGMGMNERALLAAMNHPPYYLSTVVGFVYTRAYKHGSRIGLVLFALVALSFERQPSEDSVTLFGWIQLAFVVVYIGINLHDWDAPTIKRSGSSTSARSSRNSSRRPSLLHSASEPVLRQRSGRDATAGVEMGEVRLDVQDDGAGSAGRSISSPTIAAAHLTAHSTAPIQGRVDAYLCAAEESLVLDKQAEIKELREVLAIAEEMNSKNSDGALGGENLLGSEEVKHAQHLLEQLEAGPISPLLTTSPAAKAGSGRVAAGTDDDGAGDDGAKIANTCGCCRCGRSQLLRCHCSHCGWWSDDVNVSMWKGIVRIEYAYMLLRYIFQFETLYIWLLEQWQLPGEDDTAASKDRFSKLGLIYYDLGEATYLRTIDFVSGGSVRVSTRFWSFMPTMICLAFSVLALDISKVESRKHKLKRRAKASAVAAAAEDVLGASVGPQLAAYGLTHKSDRDLVDIDKAYAAYRLIPSQLVEDLVRPICSGRGGIFLYAIFAWLQSVGPRMLGLAIMLVAVRVSVGQVSFIGLIYLIEGLVLALLPHCWRSAWVPVYWTSGAVITLGHAMQAFLPDPHPSGVLQNMSDTEGHIHRDVLLVKASRWQWWGLERAPEGRLALWTMIAPQMMLMALCMLQSVVEKSLAVSAGDEVFVWVQQNDRQGGRKGKRKGRAAQSPGQTYHGRHTFSASDLHCEKPDEKPDEKPHWTEEGHSWDGEHHLSKRKQTWRLRRGQVVQRLPIEVKSGTAYLYGHYFTQAGYEVMLEADDGEDGEDGESEEESGDGATGVAARERGREWKTMRGASLTCCCLTSKLLMKKPLGTTRSARVVVARTEYVFRKWYFYGYLGRANMKKAGVGDAAKADGEEVNRRKDTKVHEEEEKQEPVHGEPAINGMLEEGKGKQEEGKQEEETEEEETEEEGKQEEETEDHRAAQNVPTRMVSGRSSLEATSQGKWGQSERRLALLLRPLARKKQLATEQKRILARQRAKRWRADHYQAQRLFWYVPMEIASLPLLVSGGFDSELAQQYQALNEGDHHRATRATKRLAAAQANLTETSVRTKKHDLLLMLPKYPDRRDSDSDSAEEDVDGDGRKDGASKSGAGGEQKDRDAAPHDREESMRQLLQRLLVLQPSLEMLVLLASFVLVADAYERNNIISATKLLVLGFMLFRQNIQRMLPSFMSPRYSNSGGGRIMACFVSYLLFLIVQQYLLSLLLLRRGDCHSSNESAVSTTVPTTAPTLSLANATATVRTLGCSYLAPLALGERISSVPPWSWHDQSTAYFLALDHFDLGAIFEDYALFLLYMYMILCTDNGIHRLYSYYDQLGSGHEPKANRVRRGKVDVLVDDGSCGGRTRQFFVCVCAYSGRTLSSLRRAVVRPFTTRTNTPIPNTPGGITGGTFQTGDVDDLNGVAHMLDGQQSNGDEQGDLAISIRSSDQSVVTPDSTVNWGPGNNNPGYNSPGYNSPGYNSVEASTEVPEVPKVPKARQKKNKEGERCNSRGDHWSEAWKEYFGSSELPDFTSPWVVQGNWLHQLQFMLLVHSTEIVLILVFVLSAAECNEHSSLLMGGYMFITLHLLYIDEHADERYFWYLFIFAWVATLCHVLEQAPWIQPEIHYLWAQPPSTADFGSKAHTCVLGTNNYAFGIDNGTRKEYGSVHWRSLFALAAPTWTMEGGCFEWTQLLGLKKVREQYPNAADYADASLSTFRQLSIFILVLLQWHLYHTRRFRFIKDYHMRLTSRASAGYRDLTKSLVDELPRRWTLQLEKDEGLQEAAASRFRLKSVVTHVVKRVEEGFSATMNPFATQKPKDLLAIPPDEAIREYFEGPLRALKYLACKGATVLATRSPGGVKYHPGKVENVNKDGTYHVKFDDGSEGGDMSVSIGRIKVTHSAMHEPGTNVEVQLTRDQCGTADRQRRRHRGGRVGRRRGRGEGRVASSFTNCASDIILPGWIQKNCGGRMYDVVYMDGTYQIDSSCFVEDALEEGGDLQYIDDSGERWTRADLHKQFCTLVEPKRAAFEPLAGAKYAVVLDISGAEVELDGEVLQRFEKLAKDVPRKCIRKLARGRCAGGADEPSSRSGSGGGGGGSADEAGAGGDNTGVKIGPIRMSNMLEEVESYRTLGSHCVWLEWTQVIDKPGLTIKEFQLRVQEWEKIENKDRILKPVCIYLIVPNDGNIVMRLGKSRYATLVSHLQPGVSYRFQVAPMLAIKNLGAPHRSHSGGPHGTEETMIDSTSADESRSASDESDIEVGLGLVSDYTDPMTIPAPLGMGAHIHHHRDLHKQDGSPAVHHAQNINNNLRYFFRTYFAGLGHEAFHSKLNIGDRVEALAIPPGASAVDAPSTIAADDTAARPLRRQYFSGEISKPPAGQDKDQAPPSQIPTSVRSVAMGEQQDTDALWVKFDLKELGRMKLKRVEIKKIEMPLVSHSVRKSKHLDGSRERCREDVDLKRAVYEHKVWEVQREQSIYISWLSRYLFSEPSSSLYYATINVDTSMGSTSMSSSNINNISTSVSGISMNSSYNRKPVVMRCESSRYYKLGTTRPKVQGTMTTLYKSFLTKEPTQNKQTFLVEICDAFLMLRDPTKSLIVKTYRPDHEHLTKNPKWWECIPMWRITSLKAKEPKSMSAEELHTHLLGAGVVLGSVFGVAAISCSSLNYDDTTLAYLWIITILSWATFAFGRIGLAGGLPEWMQLAKKKNGSEIWTIQIGLGPMTHDPSLVLHGTWHGSEHQLILRTRKPVEFAKLQTALTRGLIAAHTFSPVHKILETVECDEAFTRKLRTSMASMTMPLKAAQQVEEARETLAEWMAPTKPRTAKATKAAWTKLVRAHETCSALIQSHKLDPSNKSKATRKKAEEAVVSINTAIRKAKEHGWGGESPRMGAADGDGAASKASARVLPHALSENQLSVQLYRCVQKYTWQWRLCSGFELAKYVHRQYKSGAAYKAIRIYHTRQPFRKWKCANKQMAELERTFDVYRPFCRLFCCATPSGTLHEDGVAVWHRFGTWKRAIYRSLLEHSLTQPDDKNAFCIDGSRLKGGWMRRLREVSRPGEKNNWREVKWGKVLDTPNRRISFSVRQHRVWMRNFRQRQAREGKRKKKEEMGQEQMVHEMESTVKSLQKQLLELQKRFDETENQNDLEDEEAGLEVLAEHSERHRQQLTMTVDEEHFKEQQQKFQQQQPFFLHERMSILRQLLTSTVWKKRDRGGSMDMDEESRLLTQLPQVYECRVGTAPEKKGKTTNSKSTKGVQAMADAEKGSEGESSSATSAAGRGNVSDSTTKTAKSTADVGSSPQHRTVIHGLDWAMLSFAVFSYGSDVLLYVAMWFAFIDTPDLLRAVYPVYLFTCLLPSNPRPPSSYLRVLAKYVHLVILIKFLVQLPNVCLQLQENKQYVLSVQPWCPALDSTYTEFETVPTPAPNALDNFVGGPPEYTKSVPAPVQQLVLWGLYKTNDPTNNRIFDSGRQRGFLGAILWDCIVLLTLYWHRHVRYGLGLWVEPARKRNWFSRVLNPFRSGRYKNAVDLNDDPGVCVARHYSYSALVGLATGGGIGALIIHCLVSWEYENLGYFLGILIGLILAFRLAHMRVGAGICGGSDGAEQVEGSLHGLEDGMMSSPLHSAFEKTSASTRASTLPISKQREQTEPAQEAKDREDQVTLEAKAEVRLVAHTLVGAATCSVIGYFIGIAIGAQFDHEKFGYDVMGMIIGAVLGAGLGWHDETVAHEERALREALYARQDAAELQEFEQKKAAERHARLEEALGKAAEIDAMQEGNGAVHQQPRARKHHHHHRHRNDHHDGGYPRPATAGGFVPHHNDFRRNPKNPCPPTYCCVADYLSHFEGPVSRSIISYFEMLDPPALDAQEVQQRGQPKHTLKNKNKSKSKIESKIDTSASFLDLRDLTRTQSFSRRLKLKLGYSNSPAPPGSPGADASNLSNEEEQGDTDHKPAWKPGKDWYEFSVATQLFIIIWSFFTIDKLCKDQVTASALRTDLGGDTFTAELVIAIVLQLVFVISDHMSKEFPLMWIKVVALHIYAWLIHFWFFCSVLPTKTQMQDGGMHGPSNFYPVSHYIFHSIYLLMSAQQVRDGYPSQTARSFKKHGYGLLVEKAYMVFFNMPFLLEMRSVLDWVCADTSLDLGMFMVVEEVYAALFMARCQMDYRRRDRYVLQGNTKQPLIWKVLCALIDQLSSCSLDVLIR
jgi:hypothetical protein